MRNFFYNRISNRRNFYSFNIWILSDTFFVVKRWAKFQSYYKYALISLCKSVQFGHLFSKLHDKNWRNPTRKSRIKIPLGSSKRVSFIFSFLVEKDQIYTRHCRKQTNKQTPTTLKHASELLIITFIAIYWLSIGILCTLIVEANNAFRWII